MPLLYIFLSIVVVYCLFQSVRFRMAAWGERETPTLGEVAVATLDEREDSMERAFHTAKGRHYLHNHKIYDGVGVLAAITLILLWANNTGLLDQVMGWVDSLPEAEGTGS